MAKIWVPAVLPGEEGKMIESDGEHDVFIREWPDGTREYDRGGMGIFIGPVKTTDGQGNLISDEEVAKKMKASLEKLPKLPDPDPKDVMKIQQFLKDRGLYEGAVNGKADVDTILALKSYEDQAKDKYNQPQRDGQGNYPLPGIGNEYTPEKAAAVARDADPDVAAAINRFDNYDKPAAHQAADEKYADNKTPKRGVSAAGCCIQSENLSPAFALAGIGVQPLSLKLQSLLTVNNPGNLLSQPVIRAL